MIKYGRIQSFGRGHLRNRHYLEVFQSVTNKRGRYTVFYFCKPLYMFRVDPPPIIRSTTLYLQQLVFVKPLLLPAARGR